MPVGYTKYKQQYDALCHIVYKLRFALCFALKATLTGIRTLSVLLRKWLLSSYRFASDVRMSGV